MRLIKPHRFRLVFLGSFFVLLAGLVTYRLIHLQYELHDYYEERADAQHFKRVVILPERGDILDRAERPLAQNTGRLTVYIHPRYLREPDFKGNVDLLIDQLASETFLGRDVLKRILAGDAPTALVRRVRSENARRILAVLDRQDVDGRGYWLHRESIRLYPRHLAASVIGFCRKDGDGDNEGLSGLELKYNEALRGQKITGRSQRTGISETIDPWDPEDLLAARGNTLVLTIDANVQEAVEEILASTVEQFQADSGGAIVMDSRDGAIVAMASYPTFDNNRFSEARPDSMRNRTLTDPLETGSVVKLFTASILLDEGLITPDTMIDCEGGYAVVDGRRLRDSPGHVLHVVPFREALRYSSNVGVVKAAQVLENRSWYRYLCNFGFGKPTGIDLPGEGSGILYPVERWTKFSRTSLPMGYELALTPVQIAAGISAVVNGGTYFEPYVVAEVHDPVGNILETHEPTAARQVIRPTTSAIMRELMEDVVDNGTGKKARIPGYRIGGKTGTTRKSDVFDHPEFIASFAGVFPIDTPRVTIYVYIDNPKTEYYASAVAAPAFREIALASALHLGIPPSEDLFAGDGDGSVEFADAAVQAVSQPAPFIGQMPNFTGLSMSEARKLLPKELKEANFLGSGVVTDQFPLAGDPLNQDTEVVLHFSPRARAGGEATQTAFYTSKTGDR